MMEISIRREGQFSINASGDRSNQCGSHGQNILNYEVRILGDENHLNDQGFIIDNNAIHNYFVDTYSKVRDFPSCENIALKACRDIRDMFGKGDLWNVQIKALAVTISGNPNAGLTARWTAPKDKVSAYAESRRGR